MEKLFSVYLTASFFGSVMILLALLLRPVLRNAPRKALCIVWLLVVMRLLVPFAPESKLSLQPQPNLYESVVTTPQPEPDDTPAPAPNLPDTPPVSAESIPDSSGNVQKPAEPVPDTPQTEKKALEPMLILAAIWLSIAGALVHYTAVSYGILKYKVRDAVRCEDGAWECDRIRGAFLLGYLRPKIYLPLGLSRQARKLIIAHEQVHMRRGDNWWKLLGILCVCIHWYNPLVWLAYVLMCQDMEEACDEQVIRRMPLEERKAYSYALLNSGKRTSRILTYPVAFGEVSLKQRIQNVLSYRSPGFWLTVVAVVLATGITVCFMTSPEKKIPQTQLSTQPTEGEKATQVTESTGSTEGTYGATEPSGSTITTEPTIGTIASQPPVTEPVNTQPPVTEPVNTQPPATEPVNTQPSATEPVNTQPSEENSVYVINGSYWSDNGIMWKFDSAGGLTFVGNGYMPPLYQGTNYPWKEYSDSITKVIVEDGITNVPRDAFSEMEQITEVYLGNTITNINKCAFEKCTALRSITIPNSKRLLGTLLFACAAN